MQSQMTTITILGYWH